MKYQVVIPKPSAKRMKKAKLTITLNDGWTVYPSKVHDLDLSKQFFEFEVKDSFEYIQDTRCSDGEVFDVFVEFSNDSGSRKEKYYLVPMVIK